MGQIFLFILILHWILKKKKKALQALLTCIVSATQLATNRTKNAFSQWKFVPEWSQEAIRVALSSPYTAPKSWICASSFVNEARRFCAKNGRLQLKAIETMAALLAATLFLSLRRFVFLICCVCEGGRRGGCESICSPDQQPYQYWHTAAERRGGEPEYNII